MSEYRKSKEKRRSMFKSIIKGMSSDSSSKGKRSDNLRKRSQTPSSPTESSGKKTRTSNELEESDEEIEGF